MRIGIILTGDYTWAGGLYYSLNIIRLLHTISLTKNIQVVALVNKNTSAELLREISLQNVETVILDKKPLLYKIWCRMLGLLTGSGYRFVSDINALGLDVLYPVIRYEKGHEKLNCRVFYWLYDFQHKFLPELFRQEEIRKRDTDFQNVVGHATDIVVSSLDSKIHLKQFYPDCPANIHVYNFVSLIEKTNVPENSVPENYLVVCNQFWPHKNHITVLKAIDHLKKNNKEVHVVFTGKRDYAPYQKYVEQLDEFINRTGIGDRLGFTGFIAREEQIGLIRSAKAVIQPSLFEGWSTVIEDAKALNKFLLVSDLPIHREQVKTDALFFKPDDFITLAGYMSDLFNNTMKVTTANYAGNIEKSVKDLSDMLGIEK